MKRLLSLLAFLVLALPTLAQRGDVKLHALPAAEKAREAATVARDFRKLELLLSEKLRYVHSNGKVDTKAAFLAALKSGAVRYEKIECFIPINGDGMNRCSEDFGMLGGTVTIKVVAEGKPLEFKAHFTAIYQWDKTRGWQLLRWQTTRIPEPEPTPR